MDEESKSAGGQAGSGSAGETAEVLLRAEIGFWRDLLRESGESLPRESVERMRQALALAELRYLQLQVTGPTGVGSSGCPTRTRRLQRGFLH